jgi:RimJ/RimL family protein N-acetyltransferase
VLRGHRLADFDACVAMWSDPIVMQFIGGAPLSAQRTWLRILEYRGHWSLLRFGFWAIEEKTTGAFVGESGFAYFRRDIVTPMQTAPEAGWVFASHAHGKGYATEAVRAIVAWGDAHFTNSRTVCLIDPRNAASIRVAARCGYEAFERGTYNAEPALFLERLGPTS